MKRVSSKNQKEKQNKKRGRGRKQSKVPAERTKKQKQSKKRENKKTKAEGCGLEELSEGRELVKSQGRRQRRGPRLQTEMEEENCGKVKDELGKQSNQSHHHSVRIGYCRPRTSTVREHCK